MQGKKPQCFICRHNLKNTSCSPCMDKGSKFIENIASDLDIELLSTEEENINSLKCSCKILMKYPEDFNIINPYKCKYYISSALKFY